MTPIPAWVISLLFLVCSLLSSYSAWRYKDWTGIVFAPVLFAFSVLYWNYSAFDVDIHTRQMQVRIGIIAIGGAILFWRVVALWLQVRR